MATTKKPKGTEAKLTISGLEVVVTHERVSIQELSLDPNNPRIRLQIRHGGKKKPSKQSELQALIRQQAGYDDLQKQIRKLGGIYDPIIVRNDGTVVEGNTRLTALLFLHSTDEKDDRWKTVPITRLPATIPEDVVEMLMANFHIAGKTMWRPAAQADQIYRLVRELNVPILKVADETRMTVREVQHYLDAYEYLVNEVLPEAKNGAAADWQQILESKFHHALEFMKGKQLQPIRDDRVNRKAVAKLIALGQITGQQVRKLPELLGTKTAVQLLKEGGLKTASGARSQTKTGVDPRIIKSMRTTSDWLTSVTQSDLAFLKKDAAATEALMDLAKAVNDVVSLVIKKPKGKHNA